MIVLKYCFVVFTGFAGGIAVGSGFVAFLTVLGVIPRLAQLAKANKYVHYLQWAVVLGAVVNGWMSLQDAAFTLSVYVLIPIGLACGVFVGMLAAALTEILNVFPILTKRVGLETKIIYLLMAIALGKIVGSLFHWIYFIE
ncbi:stage V sporulation protein AB [Priestia taiwanensis]|uniref:Stage V sporulation protein AB n=1 Tax=Priestia taiwanensis TaxID=1347902 RepID=A0A917AHW5_9BACI|nr:stage V sporulation protein AB [Priestia taiwanensis]MBM7361482.1 stage V sporulation protein AB [Priestia taiwanensis]GGE54540.1 stage V sporulation protein AB [Priestia taiwanensis]